MNTGRIQALNHRGLHASDAVDVSCVWEDKHWQRLTMNVNCDQFKRRMKRRKKRDSSNGWLAARGRLWMLLLVLLHLPTWLLVFWLTHSIHFINNNKNEKATHSFFYLLWLWPMVLRFWSISAVCRQPLFAYSGRPGTSNISKLSRPKIHD